MKEDLENTNITYHNKYRKHLLTKTGKIKCSICKYNRGENSKRTRYIKNWKRYRKHQYKELNTDKPNWLIDPTNLLLKEYYAR